MKKLLNTLFFAILISVALCVTSFAAESNVATGQTYTDANKTVWTYDIINDGSRIFASVKSVKFDNSVVKSETVIPSSFTYQSKSYNVVRIADNAFSSSATSYTQMSFIGKLTIPNTVEYIGSGAFNNSLVYGELIIPDSVKTIGINAFKDCTGITKVVFPSSITKIPSGCFRNCSSLKEFVSNGNITEVSSEAFYDCASLNKIDFKPSLVTIGSSAFRNCQSLGGKIDLSNVTNIGDDAFYNCQRVNSFVLNSNVKLGSNGINAVSVFGNCRKLSEITVNNGTHTYVTSQDGVLYTSNLQELLIYPALRECNTYNISDSVLKIGVSAFENASRITRVTGGKNVTSIGSYAFRNSSIADMYVPDKVTSLGDQVFYGCSKLQWVIFGMSVSKVTSNMVANIDNTVFTYSIVKNPSVTNVESSPTGLRKWITNGECTGHYYNYFDTAPTCESNGQKVCALCGDTQVVERTGHTGQIISRSELTCTTDNSMTIDCVICGGVRTIVYEQAQGHQFSSSSVAGSVSLKVPGYTYKKCSVCHEVVLDSFTPNAYVSGDLNGDGNINATDVNILTQIIGNAGLNVNRFAGDLNGDGKTDITDLVILNEYASSWGVSFAENKSECKNHLNVSEVTIEPVCEYSGMIIKYCTDCGKVIEQELLEESTHAFVVNSALSSEPKCTLNGKTVRKCSICNFEEEVIIPATGHTGLWFALTDSDRNYEYRRCEVCDVLDSNLVDYSKLDEMLSYITPNYQTYCTGESIAIIKPIIENSKHALTQQQVDDLVEQIRNILPELRYNVKDVPVVYLDTVDRLDTSSKPRDYTTARIMIAYKDENGELQMVSDYSGSIKIRGNSTADARKYPFNVQFSRDVQIPGLGEGDKFSLIANLFDNTLIRNAMAIEFTKLLEMDYAPNYEFVDVYLDGAYNGSYMLVTPIDIGNDRVDIDKSSDVLLQYSSGNSQSPLIYSDLFGLNMRIESPSDLSAEAYSNLQSTMNLIDYAILSGNWDLICEYIDVDSIAKYYLTHEYLKEVDMMWDSTYFYIEDGKLHGGPVWDFDLSQGNVSNTNGEDSYNSIWNKTSQICAITGGEIGNSATGTWADGKWRIDTGGQVSLWFYFLNKYSPEFMQLVYKYMIDYQEQIVKIYTSEKSYNANTGKEEEIKSTIASLAYDEGHFESFARNYEKYSAANAYNGGLAYYGNDTRTHEEAVKRLIAWFKERNEWLLGYYSNLYGSKN